MVTLLHVDFARWRCSSTLFDSGRWSRAGSWFASGCSIMNRISSHDPKTRGYEMLQSKVARPLLIPPFFLWASSVHSRPRGERESVSSRHQKREESKRMLSTFLHHQRIKTFPCRFSIVVLHKTAEDHRRQHQSLTWREPFHSRSIWGSESSRESFIWTLWTEISLMMTGQSGLLFSLLPSGREKQLEKMFSDHVFYPEKSCCCDEKLKTFVLPSMSVRLCDDPSPVHFSPNLSSGDFATRTLL